MKVSTQATKYINEHYKSAGDPAPQGVDALVQTIGAQLAAVEETSAFGARFEPVIIVKVVACEDHANSDHLHVCKVDDGGQAKDVERDEHGLVQVVCGASNVRAGMLAAWLPPGATVPSTLDSDPFVLGAREIRGVKSNGMLASAKELSLGDDHDGILEIDEALGPITPGTMFADVFHLRGDVIIDMENKMFTHRPDCFGWLGLARELAGIQHKAYKSPEWYRTDPVFAGIEDESKQLPLDVRNELPELVPRFTVITVRDVTVGPSPVWLQVDLARAGLRSINNIVDYTNFYMLLTGQPLHAYDYEKVKARSEGGAASIVIRHPKEGETLKLLNGKTLKPRAEAIMIATNTTLIGAGGIMGGADTEVDETTKHIILECGTFDMYSIRRTSMAHGLFTDAVTRFNKGQSPLQNLAALWKITDQICHYAGGKIASQLVDYNHLPKEVRQRQSLHAPVTLTTQYVNDRLGWQLSADEMRTLLINVEFVVDVRGDELTVTAPFWRTDIEIPEDIVEEIGRLNGFDKLPLDLPKRDLTPAVKNPLLQLKSAIRRQLSALGANEVLSYSFVHGNLLDKVGQVRTQAFELSNALSPGLQYLRLSLTPSLLELVHPNIKAGHESFALFELGRAHNTIQQDAEGLPLEIDSLACIFAASDKAAAEYGGAAYYQARKYLMQLLWHYPGTLQDLRYVPLAEADLFGSPWFMHVATAYDPSRSAALCDGNNQVWGIVGEYKPEVRRALKLPRYTAGFELDPQWLLAHSDDNRYRAQSRFPAVTQDLCLRVPASTPYNEVFTLVANSQLEHCPKDTDTNLWPVDIYQRPDDPEHKQVTLSLQFAHFERTLTDTEVSGILNRIAQAAAEAFGAERV